MADPKDIHKRDQTDAALRELAHRVSAYYQYLKEEGVLSDEDIWSLVLDMHADLLGGDPDDLHNILGA